MEKDVPNPSTPQATIEQAPPLKPRHARFLPPMSMGETFAAMKYPNYRLWFIGQLASMLGTWMQTTAQGFLIFQITHSAAYLGYVGFATGIPSWIFMLYGGVISDRMSRRKLMVITQTSMMLLAFILGALTLAGWVQPWHILVLAFLLGIANAFDMPARQAFTLEMVEREDLGNAIALNSAMFNSATAIGPAVAGLAYAVVGPGWCFIINGVSFIAVIIALILMKLKPFEYTARHGSTMANLREGMRYVADNKPIRSIITVVGITTLLGLSFATLIPQWAVTVLHGDSTTNGLLQSARGIGSLIAALMIASMGRFRFRGKLLTIGTFALPVMLLIFSFTTWTPLSLIMLVAVGWSMMIQFNMCNTLVQSLVPDHLRGRVMGLYSLVFSGALPIGALIFGYMATAVGSPNTIVISSIGLVFFGIIAWFAMPRLRSLE